VHLKRLIALVGPTAVGKTTVAIQLAEYFRTEIISADSRQIFKELEIGTAKPTQEELARIKHHFINSHSIAQAYDAGSYERDALALINELFKKYDTLDFMWRFRFIHKSCVGGL
jgi:tRNA dimethylallyltransferase